MDRFVTDAPNKISPMHVRVLNATGECIKEYSTPAGFRLEQYLAAQYPDYVLSFGGGNFNITVEDSEGNFVETHCPTNK
jgi:hypothetical protein